MPIHHRHMAASPEEQRKVFTAFAETTRKWVSVMDAKAAFLSALNGAVITFIWTGAKLTATSHWPERLGLIATGFALLGLLFALWAIAPRQSLRAVFGRSINWTGDYQPFSFYAFIATKYKPGDFELLASSVDRCEEKDFAREALEQHFTVSHVVYNKSLWVTRAGYLSMFAIFFTTLGLLAR